MLRTRWRWGRRGCNRPELCRSARRAFSLVYAGHAHVVSSDETNNFLTHDFESWRDFSANAPDHELVTTISFKIRIPRVIVLLFFDRIGVDFVEAVRAKLGVNRLNYPVATSKGKSERSRP